VWHVTWEVTSEEENEEEKEKEKEKDTEMLSREEGGIAISGWRTRTPSGLPAPTASHTAAFAHASVAQSVAPALLLHRCCSCVANVLLMCC